MEETTIDVVSNSHWITPIIISALGLIGTIVTAYFNKKRLEEEIKNQNQIILEQDEKIKKLKAEADAIKISYAEIITKLKTIRDYEISVDAKGISKLLNKGL